MKRVSLKHVADRCVKDPAFFRALLRNPGKALENVRMHISARDVKKLKRLTADKKAMKDFTVYSRIVRKYTRSPQGILW